jgi:hypothetical protein
MSYDAFFWYVLPWLIAVAAFGWGVYDRYNVGRSRQHLHPGE